MGPLARLGRRARRGFGRVVPEPFAVAVILSLAVLVAALARGMGPAELLAGWGATGLWKLLRFAMQMSLMLVLGSALAEAAAVRRVLTAAVGLARSPRALVGGVAAGAVALALVNWSLGLIGGALLARAAGRRARAEGWAVDYPLLCAAGYAGLMVWHGGMSGSAPLEAATREGLLDVLGPHLGAEVGAVPLSATLLSRLNLWVTGGLFLLAPLVFSRLLLPSDPDARPIPEAAVRAADLDPAAFERPAETALERLERAPALAWLLAAPMAGAVALRLAGGGRLNFDTVNLALWALALLAHGRPDRFLAACEHGVRACTGVILHFPLYAGIMAVMGVSGMSADLASWVGAAGAGGLLVAVFVSAGVLNVLVPSGGGQWAVQGPILVRAALDLGVPVPAAIMAMAYGDQWTNMLQPFWALPLLAITGIRARDMVGYSALWMAIGGLWIVACLLLVA